MSESDVEKEVLDKAFRETLDKLRQQGQHYLNKLSSSSPASQKYSAKELLATAEDIEKLVRTWINVMCRDVDCWEE